MPVVLLEQCSLQALPEVASGVQGEPAKSGSNNAWLLEYASFLLFQTIPSIKNSAYVFLTDWG